MLAARGVTAWQRALATVTAPAQATAAAAAGPVPAAAPPPMAAELTGILAGLALGGP